MLRIGQRGQYARVEQAVQNYCFVTRPLVHMASSGVSFPAPSSSTAVHQHGQRPPKGLGTDKAVQAT